MGGVVSADLHFNTEDLLGDQSHAGSFPLPTSLQSLLAAASLESRETAWASFLEEHSGLVLHVARRLGGDHDAVMDRYAFILDALRRDDFHRLRTYLADRRGKFTTWLMVVTRRLCLDHYRQRYGRPQGAGPATAERHAERRNLTDLVGDELDLAALAAPEDRRPDHAVHRGELLCALQDALSRLDVSDRLLLRLRFEDGLSVPEIARLTGTDSPFQVYRRIDRLLTSLGKTLRAAGVEDSTP